MLEVSTFSFSCFTFRKEEIRANQKNHHYERLLYIILEIMMNSILNGEPGSER